MIKNSRIELGKTPVPGTKDKCSKIVDGNPVSDNNSIPNKSFDKIASIIDNDVIDEKHKHSKNNSSKSR